MDCIDVYYSPKQVSCPDSSSPSPSKPALVVADWVAQGLPIRIVEPVPASRAQIALAHAPAYVDGILNCELMNGFRGRQKEVSESLPWTCGSLLSCSKCCVEQQFGCVLANVRLSPRWVFICLRFLHIQRIDGDRAGPEGRRQSPARWNS